MNLSSDVLLDRWKRNKWELIVLSVFLLCYSAISLVNHYNFRTSALDLGMHNHSLHCFSQGINHYFTLDVSGGEVPFLGNHFSPVVLLYVPLYWVFGSYTLLLVQIFAVLIGGVGVMRLSSFYLQTDKARALVMIHFLGMWGIFSALSFDFHHHVVAAMLLPWLFLFYEQGRRMPLLLVTLFILLSKENLSLWLVFVFLGLALKDWRSQWHKARIAIVYLGISLLSFLLILLVFVPFFKDGQPSSQLVRYAHLGGDISEIGHYLLVHPLEAIKMIFVNATGDSDYDWIKTELHLVVLVSGGVLCLLRPYLLLMLVPIFVQKLFSNDILFWGISMQYSIEFVPILSLALILFLRRVSENNLRQWALVFAGLSVGVTVYSMTGQVSKGMNKRTASLFDKRHYNPEIDLSVARKAIAMIPDDVPVSASITFAPHLAQREKLYHFPVIKDAAYVVVFTQKRGAYPFHTLDLVPLMKVFKKDHPEFEVILEEAEVMVLKRKGLNK